MAEIHCRYFNGYKPCGFSTNCNRSCADFDEIFNHVVIIHLGALGAVLRSTALLPSIRRKYPKSKITWITKSPAEQLLLHNPLIDRVLTLSGEDLLSLDALDADAVLCIDKSLVAAGIARKIKSRALLGFKSDLLTGAILPANEEARELWSLGLSDQKKFFENAKTENQLVHEALALGAYQYEEYQYQFAELEQEIIRNRRTSWAPHGEAVVGLNTGCSGVIPYKKLTVEFHREVIKALQSRFGLQIKPVLLGGSEDTRRNREIGADLDVISSPTDRGIRDGMMSVAACDIVISGDSLGLHMAIANQKWCVAWFGPTCQQEIELYGRGRKILTKASCSPCWKRVCDRRPMCYDLVDLNEILDGVAEGIEKSKAWPNSSSKLPTPETSFSAFRF